MKTLKWQMNSQMINCTFVSLSITLTELTMRRKVVTSITMVECATVISGDQMIKLHVKKKITNGVSKNQYSLNQFHLYRPYNFQSCTLVELRHWTDHKQSKIQFFSKYALKIFPPELVADKRISLWRLLQRTPSGQSHNRCAEHCKKWKCLRSWSVCVKS